MPTSHSSTSSRDDAVLFADDGLHPGAQMYAMWVDAILPSVEGMLTSK